MIPLYNYVRSFPQMVCLLLTLTLLIACQPPSTAPDPLKQEELQESAINTILCHIPTPDTPTIEPTLEKSTEPAHHDTWDHDLFSIERVDNSISSNYGILGEIYYEKLNVSSRINFSDEINAFFERECQEFLSWTPSRFNDFEEGRLDRFMESLSHFIDINGEEEMVTCPLQHYVDTEVVLLTDNILSVRRICFGSFGGPTGTSYFGSTFDLSNGKLMSLDQFMDVDILEFTNELIGFLSENETSYPLDDMNENFEGRDYCDFEFFYDSEFLYIVLNHWHVQGNNFVLKWNMLSDKSFDFQLITFWKHGNGEYEEILIY